MNPVRVGVVGYGYWGPNLARNFADVEGGTLAAVCDERPDKQALARSRHPGTWVVGSFDELLSSPDIDAVVLATPVSTHAPLALRALRAGKHVLVEKPLAGNAADAAAVVREAEQAGLTLMTDHTFVYMGATRKVKQIIEQGELGDLYYFDSVRVSLGLFQHDVSVIWDLASHDLSIAQFWIPQQPEAISCVGVAHVEGLPEDVAYLTLYYPDNLIAHVHVNWLSPVKVRRTILAGSSKTIVFDDLHPDEKVRLYTRGVTREEAPVGSNLIPLAYRRTGDIWIPQLDQTEALSVMAAHFVASVANGTEPITGGRPSLRIVRMLEAAERSLKSRGAVIELDDLD